MSDLLFDIQTPVADAQVAAAAGQGPAGDCGEAVARPAGPAHLLTIHVVGVPQPQGSKRAFVTNGGRAVVVDDNKKTLRTWRDDVKAAALDAIGEREGSGSPFAMIGGPTALDITFLMPRPRGHYGTGRNAHQLRARAPARPTTKPDVDKLLRSTLDALKVAGVYADDSQVVTLTGRKHYATNHPGAVIQVYRGEDA